MKQKRNGLFLLCVVPGFIAGCSGMGTSMSKMGRLGQNRGYEMAAELPVVERAAMDVLAARGYAVSVKPDPDDGAEGVGQIVIGQMSQRYTDTAASSTYPGAAPSGAIPQAIDTRSLVDVYVTKKWQMGSDLGVPNITLVDIVGGNYQGNEPAAEVETPFTADFIGKLRDEIERAVDASRRIAPGAKVPGI